MTSIEFERRAVRGRGLRVVCVALLSACFALWARGASAQAPEAQPAPPDEAVVEPPPTGCANPRHAIDTVFAWQQPERTSLEAASRCLDLPGRSVEARHAAARAIKEVYDGRALYVDVPSMSTEPEHLDPVTGLARVVVHPGLPEVVVERQLDGQWKWTTSSIRLVEELHAQSFARQVEGRLPKLLVGEVFGVKLWQYLAIAMSLVIGLLARRVLHYVATRKLAALERGEKLRWVGSLVTTIASPGATLVVAGALRLSYPELGLPIGASLAMAFAVRTIVVLTFVWIGYRLVDVFAEWLASKANQTDSKLDDQLVPLLRKSLKVVVVILGTLMVLQNLGVDVGSLLAGLGIGGLAFALAAKDTIANFFGSVMIFVDKPFQIGDWVAVDGCEGIVEEVGFRTTRLRAFDNSLIAIPNMKFTEQKIVNFGARRYRRHFTTLNLGYDTSPEQLQAFVEGVRGIVLAHPTTRKDAFEIHMSGFGAHSLDVMLYYFFEVSTWSAELEGRHEVMLSILRLAKDLGVSFAFPTRTLHIVEAAQPGAERALPRRPPREELVRLVSDYGPSGDRGRELPPLAEARHRPGSYAPSASSG